jgi:glycosyltransferase involved in cell wall biosynthesis
MRVAQILCAAGPVDAVTNQALAYRESFRRWGWSGEDYAPVQAPDMGRVAIRPLHQLRPEREQLVVLHYSGYAPGLERVLAACPPSLLVSHNITPAEYFWANDPVEAVRCQLARGQLAQLARQADALAGVSEFNAAELRELGGREAAVIPVLFDRRRLPAVSPCPPGSPPAPDPPLPPGPPVVLFVGRLVPHKRQDLVIRAFARMRRAHPGARLVLVGVPLSPDFAAALARLADELAPGAVTFEVDLTAAQLWDRYRAAHAFLCLSEHEGFCIPLLEAFHFQLPVIARDAGAVGEVIGDAGVRLGNDDRIATVAELLSIVVTDAELRAELARRGRRRLAVYDHDRTAERLRETLVSLGAR